MNKLQWLPTNKKYKPLYGMSNSFNIQKHIHNQMYLYANKGETLQIKVL